MSSASMAEWLRAWATLGHDEAMEAGGREFDPRPGHYSRMRFYFLVQPGNWHDGFTLNWTFVRFNGFSHLNVPFLQNSEFIWNVVLAVNYRPSAPFLYEVASRVKSCRFADYYYYYIFSFQGVSCLSVMSINHQPPLAEL